MNIRLVAVDENGREIQDDDGAEQVPVHSIVSETVPRIGEEVMFYNTHGRDFVWDVVGVTWMISPNDQRRGDGVTHVCVELRRQTA